MRQVIAITGMDDRDQPDQAIAITGIRTLGPYGVLLAALAPSHALAGAAE
jgi:hypothetical protein